MSQDKPKLALVLGTIPTVDDVDQFQLLSERYDISVVTAQSIVGFLTQMSYFQDLICMALPDYDDNPSYLPGLEKVLSKFDIVLVKGRLGLYAYQCVKAKWRHKFRLIVWLDNLATHPGEDIVDMKVIRTEVTNAADGFIVQTKAAASLLKMEEVGDERIIHIPPWVSSHVKKSKKLIAKAREDLGLAESHFVICYFGQIEWEEGLADFVAALKLTMKEKPSLRDKIKVIFCGIGTYATQLRDAFVGHGIDDIAVYVKPTRQSHEAIYLASNAMFLNSIQSRDRTDGDPYRILSAMLHEIPVIASRSAPIEEMCGKHRIDFCPGSIGSLSAALIKAESAKSLMKDIAKKNVASVKQRFNQELVQKCMTEAFDNLTGLKRSIDKSSVDHMVMEVEARITNKQYLDAIEIIEGIFKRQDVPTHHKANLYRLIGDCFAKLGDNEAAKDAYIQAAELDPYSAKVYIGLGTLSLVKNSYDIAVLHFQKAVGLAPSDEMANLGLGLAFHGMEERVEAKRWVLKSLAINYENTAAIFTLVKLANELDDYKDCEESLSKYLEVHPNDYNMIFTLAGIYYKLGRFSETLALTDKITSVDPMDSKSHALAKQAKRAMEDKSKVSGS